VFFRNIRRFAQFAAGVCGAFSGEKHLELAPPPIT
jgi:hypothetical protein